jgi:hypothetical protein
MAAPFNRLRSKLNRAICAYLIQQKVGTADDTFPENSQAIKTYPVTLVRACAALEPNEGMTTGNRNIIVLITVKGSAVRNTAKPADIQSARIAFETRLTNVNDALLMQSSDNRTLKATARAITLAGRALAVSDPDNNADMADFTCQWWINMGEGDLDPDQEGTAWQEALKFKSLCSPSNVD